jgi:hypothetical protein
MLYTHIIWIQLGTFYPMTAKALDVLYSLLVLIFWQNMFLAVLTNPRKYLIL